ncbi:conserved hypothetical protein [Coccidioides posadasii str. Silveira]|uniref:Uncharacterized protein n=1 Tax=Coccidioides posadasii (strain RMSCC 757 / Silveira) TaxID=443226 RepID=E9D870_COCPS|nr:conserved hypothetical protein [Coccidioides posadasii str. Silveira]
MVKYKEQVCRKEPYIIKKRLQRSRIKLVRLEIKIMIYNHDYLATVSVLRKRVEKKMREFLSQLQSLSEDNNSSPVPEKIKKDDFEIVMFSNKNDEENNEMEND